MELKEALKNCWKDILQEVQQASDQKQVQDIQPLSESIIEKQGSQQNNIESNNNNCNEQDFNQMFDQEKLKAFSQKILSALQKPATLETQSGQNVQNTQETSSSLDVDKEHQNQMEKDCIDLDLLDQDIVMFSQNGKPLLGKNQQQIIPILFGKDNKQLIQVKSKQIKLYNMNLQNLAEYDQIVQKFDPKKFIQKLNLGKVGNIKEWDQSEVDKKTMEKIAQLQKQYKQKKQKIGNNHNKYIHTVSPLKKNYQFTNKGRIQNKQSSVKKIVVQQKGKVAKKSGKDFPIQPQKKLIDVGALSFKALGKQCYKRGILNQQLFKEFQVISSDDRVREFVKLFDSGKIKNKDFSNRRLTIMDHRRMCEYLIKFCPEQYYYKQIKNEDLNVKKFLQNLFSLEPKQYKILIDSLDSTSSVTWWNSVQQKYQKQLLQRKNKSKDKQWIKASKNIDLLKKQLNSKKQEYKKDKNKQFLQQDKKKAYNKEYELSSSSLSSEEQRTKPKITMNIPKKKITK